MCYTHSIAIVSTLRRCGGRRRKRIHRAPAAPLQSAVTEGEEEPWAEAAAAHTAPFKARGCPRLRTCADPGKGRGRSPARTRRPAFVRAAALADPSRERPRYLRAASASMAAPLRVRLLLPSPRAPALPLGVRTQPHRGGRWTDGAGLGPSHAATSPRRVPSALPSPSEEASRLAVT